MRAYPILLLVLAWVKAENGSVMQMTGGGLKAHRPQASTGKTGAGRMGSPAAEGRPGGLQHIPGDRALCRSGLTGTGTSPKSSLLLLYSSTRDHWYPETWLA